MKQVLVRNLSRAAGPPVRARYCVSFLCRLQGLIFRRALPPQEGLLLVQGRESRLDSAIHMLGVFMDLAVVWIDGTGEVVDIRLARRWRPAYVPRRPARFVLELSPERLEDYQIGDRLHFDEVPVG